MSKKKKEVKIIKKNRSNENYTFVSNNILNIKDNENNSENKKTSSSNREDYNEIIEKKKIHSKKIDNKGRKVLGKSMQSHSPVYE